MYTITVGSRQSLEGGKGEERKMYRLTYTTGGKLAIQHANSPDGLIAFYILYKDVYTDWKMEKTDWVDSTPLLAAGDSSFETLQNQKGVVTQS